MSRVLFSVAAAVLGAAGGAGFASVAAGADGGGSTASVLEHHAGPRRSGVYVDPTLTRAAAAGFHRDATFNAAIPGAIYAQPLHFAGGPGGKDLVVAATEQDEVAAFDAATGAAVWRARLGTPVPRTRLPCGNIDPLGVTGTPVIDAAARTLYADAMTTPDGGVTRRHLVFALSLDDGSVRPGWPVDVNATARFGSVAFDSTVQNQRGALAFVNGTLYVPYGGHYGDCGNYRGWLVGIPTADPTAVRAWATGARGGGSWAPGGVASDGAALYIATGNTFGTSLWAGGEALIRFAAGPTFGGKTADYFAPSNWRALDAGDVDLGGSGPLVVDVPGATPSRLLVGLGKDGKIYLVNRDDLGGVGGQVAVASVASTAIIGAAASYAGTGGTYVVFRGKGIGCPAGQSGDLTAVRIAPASPPVATVAWCADQGGMGSPMVTTTDGRAEAVVWSVGAEGDQRLHGFHGDTGQVVFAGGGAADGLGPLRRYNTPIMAKGRIFVAVDGGVKAFVR